RDGLAARFCSGVRVDGDARWLGADGARRDLRRLQPAGRAGGRGQGRICELGDADGAAPVGPRNDPVSSNALGRIAYLAASRLSGAVSDGGDLPRSSPDRPPASAQCVRGTFSAVPVAAFGEDLMGIVWR